MVVRDPEDMSHLRHKSHLLVVTAMIRILLRVPVEGTGAAEVAIQHGSFGQASAWCLDLEVWSTAASCVLGSGLFVLLHRGLIVRAK
jgi:hypothetical protein